MANIKSLPKVDKYSDFKKYCKLNPYLTNIELARAYHVNSTTISNWKKKMRMELQREKV